MKQIIWIFGTSASGKETFIKSLKDDDLLKKVLGIDEEVAISNESLKNLGKLDKSRLSIIDDVLELSSSNDVIVIKWQYGDTLLDTPNLLYKKLPNFKHRAVKLNVDTQEQVRRLQTKSWRYDHGKEENFIANELELVDSSIGQLNPDLEVTNFD